MGLTQAPLQQNQPGGHTVPQAPQLRGSLPGFLQTPLQQRWVLLQPAPQAPQFFGSLLGSMQTPKQRSWPLGQACASAAGASPRAARQALARP
jgi:hypothetical protein